MKKIKEKTHSQALIFNDTNINFKISAALQFLRVLLLTAFASFLFCNEKNGGNYLKCQLPIPGPLYNIKSVTGRSTADFQP